MWELTNVKFCDVFLNKTIEIGTIRGWATPDAPYSYWRKNIHVGAAVTLNVLHNMPAINGSVICQYFAL